MEQTLFLAMANQYKDMIFRIALNYFRSPHDAEDAVQEVLLKLYTSGKPFESEQHIRNWLIRVTVNYCKNALRRPFRHRDVAYEAWAESVSFEHEGESDLFQAVMALPEAARTVVYLFYYEELSVRAIANLLKLSESNVTTRLSRARKQLKLTLTEEFDDE